MVNSVNHFVLSGTVKELPKLHNTKEGLPYTEMKIDVVVRKDYVSNELQQCEYLIKLWNEVASHTVELSNIGDKIVFNCEVVPSNEYGKYELIANKVFLLSTE